MCSESCEKMKETIHWTSLAKERKEKTIKELEKLPTDKYEFYFSYESFWGALYKLEPRTKHRFLGKNKSIKIAELSTGKNSSITVHDKASYDICKDIAKKCDYEELIRYW